MKPLLILPVTLLLTITSCTKQVTSSEQDNITDSTLTQIFHATLDSTRTIMEVDMTIVSFVMEVVKMIVIGAMVQEEKTVVAVMEKV